MVFGTFDRFHPGHAFVLAEASRRGRLTVVIARDHHVLSIKGHTPAEDERTRLDRVKKEVPDATVILGDEKDFLVPIRSVRPDLILLGYDQLLPPGVSLGDLACPIERLESFKPEMYKSSRSR